MLVDVGVYQSAICVRFLGYHLVLRFESEDGVIVDFLRDRFEPYCIVERCSVELQCPWLVSVRNESSSGVDFECFKPLGIRVIDAGAGDRRISAECFASIGLFGFRFGPSGVVGLLDSGGLTLLGRGMDFRFILFRVVEDFILAQVQHSGGVVLHASAVVSSSGDGILYIGNKKAGKTSALLRSLNFFDASLLSTDNIVAMPQDGLWRVHGWPSLLKISLGTLQGVERLHHLFPKSDSLLSQEKVWAVYEKVSLSPRSGAEIFGASVTLSSAISCIILPTFSDSMAPGLQVVDCSHLSSGFLEGVFNANHCNWLNLWPSEEDVSAAFAKLLAWLDDAMVPIYELTWGPSLDEWLARVPGIGPYVSHRSRS